MEKNYMDYGEETYEILLKNSSQIKGCYKVKDFSLFLDNMPVYFRGGIVIGKGLENTFHFEENYPCYCYETVIELIFNEGKLITTIDHSKAMDRIRKNIEKGLRNLDNEIDLASINKFLRKSFVKKYPGNFKFNRWWLFYKKNKKMK